MFPQQGEEIACDFGIFSVMDPGELFVDMNPCQVFERKYKKPLRNLTVFVASTVDPISYFRKSV